MPDVNLWIPASLPRRHVKRDSVDKVKEIVAKHLECDGLTVEPREVGVRTIRYDPSESLPTAVVTVEIDGLDNPKRMDGIRSRLICIGSELTSVLPVGLSVDGVDNLIDVKYRPVPESCWITI